MHLHRTHYKLSLKILNSVVKLFQSFKSLKGIFEITESLTDFVHWRIFNRKGEAGLSDWIIQRRLLPWIFDWQLIMTWVRSAVPVVCTVPLTERNCYQHKQMVVHSIRPNVTAGLTVEGDTQWSKDTLRESPCLSIFFCLRFCIFYGDFHWLVAKPSQGSIFHKKGPL